MRDGDVGVVVADRAGGQGGGEGEGEYRGFDEGHEAATRRAGEFSPLTGAGRISLGRRSLLIGGALALGGVADDRILLWPGSPPGGGGPAGPERVSGRGAVTNVASSSLQVFAPARPNRASVIVAAGGGYRRIEQAYEGMPAVRWLVARGYTAFLLTYRLPGEGWAAGPLAPLQDAQRALLLVRMRARAMGLDPAQVSLLGFSAGGHLMGMLAACARPAERPEGAALIYPVITLAKPYDQTQTRRALVGDDPAPAMAARWSVQTHVRAGCPSMFLVQAVDDPVSNPQNTLIMQAACERAGVPVELLQLPSGGHGFGMGWPNTPSAQWPAAYGLWLAGLQAGLVASDAHVLRTRSPAGLRGGAPR